SILPPRRLVLSGQRYTFGSDPAASIRLSDANLRHIHAALLRDDQRVILRTYGSPVMVNGVPETERRLELGDWFQMGAYRFDLIRVPRNRPTVTPPKRRAHPVPIGDPAASVMNVDGGGQHNVISSSDQPAGALSSSSLNDVYARLDLLTDQINQMQSTSGLQDQTDLLQRHNERLQQQIADVSRAAQDAMQQRESEFQAQSKSYIEESKQHGQSLLAAITQRDQARAETDTLQQKLDQQLEATTRRFREFEAQVQRGEATIDRLNDSVKQLEQERGSLHCRIDELTEQVDGLQVDHGRVQTELAAATQQQRQTQEELAATQDRHQATTEELQKAMKHRQEVQEELDEATRHREHLQEQLRQTAKDRAKLKRQIQHLMRNVTEAREDAVRLGDAADQAKQSVER
ncbi:MAG: FHA domain-containing protein, partial [Planctomycetota bacterium]